MKNAFLLASRLLGKITSNKHEEAFELFDNFVSTLRKFECGTGTILSCPLLQADKVKTAKAKNDKRPKHTTGMDHPGSSAVTPATKCQCSQKTPNMTPSADDLSGTLLYTGTNMLPSVNDQNVS